MRASLYHHPHHHSVGQNVGEGDRLEEEIMVGLVRNMSHCLPHSRMQMIDMSVQVWLIAETTPEEGVLLEDYYCCHHEVLPYAVAPVKDIAMNEDTER